jgi:hypothetical protein
MNCDPSPSLNCSTNHHICVSPKTNESICLPIEKANDGIIDCLGAADEPTLCRDYSSLTYYPETFYCYDKYFILCMLAQYICDKQNECAQSEDEQACKSNDLSGVSVYKGICTGDYESDGSDVAKILCRRFSQSFPKERVHFTLDQWQNLIKRHQKQENTLPYQSVKQNVKSYQPRCHRGLDLQVWLDKQKKIKTNVCLCPPSYYGDICQYQNQRVSLTLQFRVSSDSVQTPFIIIVSLIEDTDERIIHSSEQFTYLSIKNCQRKFDIYLLYSTKPKDETKDYSIHIDIYEKTTKLDYRTSFIKSLNFTFLPVHRVALQINIPRILDNDCSDVQCQNGKCRKYFNDQHNRTFCQCERGWSGRYCTIPYISACSSDSLSLGQLANNRSLCVCPVNKIGPRCLINDITCQNITCLNSGECIPIDEYKTFNKTFVCICPKEFLGDQCEIARTKLMMIFDKNITVPSSILIHFIEAKLDASPVRTTIFKTTLSEQDSIIVYWSLPFHIAFVELENKNYYLTYMQPIYNQSKVIERTLTSFDRCLNISELFNETFANSSLLRRIKSYHLPCQRNRSQLKCFYDEIHFCLCQQISHQYVANCFEFDHNMSSFCAGQNVCENDGQCFQEQTPCSRVFACRCPICYYGVQCQLSTSGFSLSLDAILGYHIRPNLNISQQPSAVLISLVLMVIITLLGFANGILSLITFKTKTTHESGCGLYLFSSSIITLSTMVIFFFKFLILLLSQMGSITNRSFLTIQCHSIDFLLRFCLTMDQWLTAFVAIERTFVVRKGVNFNKKKFKSLAKWAISGLVVISMVTNIHDPIYRKLFIADDNVDDEKKLWCIVEYPSAIRIINLIINIIHFIVPFIINVISALTIIIMSTRQQVAIKKKKKYREILKEQIHERKNLLIGSSVLAILAVPRLIISFVSGCMKSINDSWLFLLGYFISLIPPLLTFILFVLPSKTYKDAFRKAISRHKNLINRRLLR